MSDRIFRCSQLDGWLKGNTHIHTTRSDGGMTFADPYATVPEAARVIR